MFRELPRPGVFIASGFDDGAAGTPDSPTRVVFRNDGGEWERLDVPSGVDGSIIVRMCGTSAFEAEFPDTRIAQLAEAPDGSIWAAGAIVDEAGETGRPMIWKRVPE